MVTKNFIMNLLRYKKLKKFIITTIKIIILINIIIIENISSSINVEHYIKNYKIISLIINFFNKINGNYYEYNYFNYIHKDNENIIVKYLTENTLENILKYKDRYNNNILFKAIMNKENDIAKFLINNYSYLAKEKNLYEENSLIIAIKSKNNIITNKLIKKFPDLIQDKDINKENSLTTAIILNSNQIAKILISKDLKLLNQLNRKGNNSIFVAIEQHNNDFFIFLFENFRYLLNHTNYNKEDALSIAINNNNNKLAKFLVTFYLIENRFNEKDIFKNNTKFNKYYHKVSEILNFINQNSTKINFIKETILKYKKDIKILINILYIKEYLFKILNKYNYLNIKGIIYHIKDKIYNKKCYNGKIIENYLIDKIIYNLDEYSKEIYKSNLLNSLKIDYNNKQIKDIIIKTL